MTKLYPYGIPDDQLLAMQQAADLAWRGISYPRYAQAQRRDAQLSDAIYATSAPIVGAQTELERFVDTPLHP